MSGRRHSFNLLKISPWLVTPFTLPFPRWSRSGSNNNTLAKAGHFVHCDVSYSLGEVRILVVVNRKWNLLRRSGKKSCRNQVDAYWAIYWYMLPRSFHCPSQHSSITRIWEETKFFSLLVLGSLFFSDILSLKIVESSSGLSSKRTRWNTETTYLSEFELPNFQLEMLPRFQKKTNFRRAHGYLSFLKLSNLFYEEDISEDICEAHGRGLSIILSASPPTRNCGRNALCWLEIRVHN